MMFINTNIAKHPLNYLVIWSMLLMIAFTAHLIMSGMKGKHPGDTSDGPSVGPGTAAASDANSDAT